METSQLKPQTKAIIDDLIARIPALGELMDDLTAAVQTLAQVYRRGGKILVCGNGGSAADAEHIVGELMKGFLLARPLSANICDKLRRTAPTEADYLIKNLQMPLPAVSLVNQVALNTAFANDQAPDLTFAQQILGMGREGDAALVISTSGNSANVLYAVQVAKAMGLVTVALTGKGGGKLKNLADISIVSPEKETFLIQEHHLPIYHALCAALEQEFFG